MTAAAWWKPFEWAALGIISVALVIAAWWWKLALTEALGFVTGMACVYLVVRQDVLNFPLGMANNVFLFVVFVGARLYGDASLQIVYLGLAWHGWRSWLHGGAQHRQLEVTHAPDWLRDALGILVLAGTVLLAWLLYALQGSAPMLDALTTLLSLAAQYLLNRKHIETWLLWITADVLYIYLYLQRDLQLTAALYAVFLAMCVAGWWTWRRSLRIRTR